MLQYIGRSTAVVPEITPLTGDEFTIGRDAKCSLVLDSLVSPRMISRVHVKLCRTQPPSAALVASQRSASRAAARTASRMQQQQLQQSAAASPPPAAPQPFVPRWLLTDEKSVNGCFVNDIKVSQSLLSNGDILTIGGLGLKLPIGTFLPQPDAEFIFRFVQPPPQPQSGHDDVDATLPMPAAGEVDIDRTLPPPDEAEEEEEEGEGSAHSEDQERKHESSADEEPEVEDEEEEEDAPTQVLPPDPVPAPASAAERRPSLRRQPSNDNDEMMVDATFAQTQTVAASRTRSRGGAAAAASRTFSAAPTQLLPSDAADPATARMETESFDIHVTPAGASSAAAAAPSAAVTPLGVDLHAYRVSATIDASMADAADPSLCPSDNEDDARPSTARAMSIDATMADSTQCEATQVLPSSQAATQVTDPDHAAVAAAASISSSLLSDLDGMAMMTQTQVLPDFERAPSVSAPAAAAAAAAAAEARTPARPPLGRKPPSKSDLLYDDAEDDDAPPASSAAAAAAFASPVAAAAAAAASSPAASSPVTPASKKKRGRDDDQEEVVVLSDEDEEEPEESAPHKKRRFDRKKSSLAAKVAPVAAAAAASSSAAAAASSLPATAACPICAKHFPLSQLERHSWKCSEQDTDGDAALARKLAAEEEAAVAAAAAAAAADRRRPKKSLARKVRSSTRYRFMDREEPEYCPHGCEDYGDCDRCAGGDEAEEDEGADEEYDEAEVGRPPAAGFGAFKAAGAAAGGFGGGLSAFGAFGAAAAAAASSSAAAAAKKAAEPKAACPLCNKLFPQSDLPDHADVCEGADEECDKCQHGFIPSQLAAHRRTCAGPDAMCGVCEEMIGAAIFDAHIRRCIGKDSKECPVCQGLFPTSEFDAHQRHCMQREANMSQDEKLAMTMQRGEQHSDLVNDMQTAAISWVAKQAEELSTRAEKALLSRFHKLGYSDKDFKETVRYIRKDAPLIIHVNLTNCMKFFVADTHYRNQFETKTSCGTLSSSARTQWEDGLFNRIYHRASGYERVKYGVLNIVQDPNGVLACRGYGDSYLLLKSDTVRLRTSFASRDTGGGTAKLASCEWYCHVLSEYADPELIDVISVATKQKMCVSSARISTYKEVQFHGPIEFARDIEAIVVHRRHQGDKAMMKLVEEFANNNKCNIIMMEEDGR